MTSPLAPAALPRVVLILLALVLAGGCGGETNPAMSLQFSDRVFVPVDPGSLPAKNAKGHYPGKVANFHRLFTHTDITFEDSGTAPAIVIYSNVRYLPIGTTYTATRPVHLYEAALADGVASGIVVNPQVNGAKSYVMTRSEIKAAFPRVMQHKPLVFEVHVAGND